MGIKLSQNQYGKAETRVVRIYRDTERHEIRDLKVSTALRGDFAAAHLVGDQANVLPTDSQKNTCFAYAKERGVGAIEDYALALAEHFVTDIPSVTRARVDVDEYRWERVKTDGAGHAHTFVRTGHEVRTTGVTFEAAGGSGGSLPRASTAGSSWVVSGIKDLVVLKSTGSEFAGFYRDRYTTLPETTDRILATSLTARWRYAGGAGGRPPGPAQRGDAGGRPPGPAQRGDAGGRPPGPAQLSGEVDWDVAFGQVRQILLERFALVHSRALQQTLYEMGAAVLAARDDVAEIRLSAPNKHHFLADLAPLGLDNPGEVFFAADRPYGLIQCAVERDDAPLAGPAWETPDSFA